MKVMEAKSASSTGKDISGHIVISRKGHDESLATLDEPSDARMPLAQHEVKRCFFSIRYICLLLLIGHMMQKSSG